jgi:hypothetical protein
LPFSMDGRLFYYEIFFFMKYGLCGKPKTYTVVFLFLLCSLACIQSSAQTPDSSKKYQLFLEPYIMFTSMSGTTGIGRLPNTFVCVPAGKVFSFLKIGGMLYAEVHNDQFAFTSDLFYASLSQDASTKNSIISGSASLKQFWWELEGLYRVNPWLEFGVGARINNITAGVNINFTPPIGSGSASGNDQRSNTWVDPLIVTRLRTWINNKWLLQLRADIGGFGIGSQFAWQLQPDIGYRASKLLELGIGYRIISMNYTNGTQGTANYFLYDMNEYGPQVRIGFNF